MYFLGFAEVFETERAAPNAAMTIGFRVSRTLAGCRSFFDGRVEHLVLLVAGRIVKGVASAFHQVGESLSHLPGRQVSPVQSPSIISGIGFGQNFVAFLFSLFLRFHEGSFSIDRGSTVKSPKENDKVIFFDILGNERAGNGDGLIKEISRSSQGRPLSGLG
jgi:hypothetical protein